MSIGNEGIPAVMSVTPYNGNGNGGWGGDWGAWIVLFLLAGMFGFGGFGMGGFGMGGFGMGGLGFGGYGVESILQRSLDTQSIIGKLDGITNGLCDGFYAQAQALNGLGTTVMQGFNQATIANLQGQNAIQTQLSGCCCDLQRAVDGVNYNAQSNANLTNVNIANGVRDIVDNQNSNTRAILDYLCNEKIQSLRDENQTLKLAASQSEQNALLRATIDAQTAEILRRTGNDCPQAAYIVQPPQPVSFATNCSGQAVFNNGFGFNGCGNG